MNRCRLDDRFFSVSFLFSRPEKQVVHHIIGLISFKEKDDNDSKIENFEYVFFSFAKDVSWFRTRSASSTTRLGHLAFSVTVSPRLEWLVSCHLSWKYVVGRVQTTCWNNDSRWVAPLWEDCSRKHGEISANNMSQWKIVSVKTGAPDSMQPLEEEYKNTFSETVFSEFQENFTNLVRRYNFESLVSAIVQPPNFVVWSPAIWSRVPIEYFCLISRYLIYSNFKQVDYCWPVDLWFYGCLGDFLTAFLYQLPFVPRSPVLRMAFDASDVSRFVIWVDETLKVSNDMASKAQQVGWSSRIARGRIPREQRIEHAKATSAHLLDFIFGKLKVLSKNCHCFVWMLFTMNMGIHNYPIFNHCYRLCLRTWTKDMDL